MKGGLRAGEEARTLLLELGGVLQPPSAQGLDVRLLVPQAAGALDVGWSLRGR